MEETKKTEEAKVEETAAEETKQEVKEEKVTKLPPSKKGKGKRGRKIETVKEEPKEWEERVVQIRRVTKVCKGGKKLSFRAIVVVGNGKGQVGVGVAKAAEVITAIQKAVADGRKNLVTVPIFKTSIPHSITGRAGAGSVVLRPASQGTGIIAGGAIRAVLELAGIENILSKSLGSKGPLNNANATLNALQNLRSFKDVAENRGMTLNEMLN